MTQNERQSALDKRVTNAIDSLVVYSVWSSGRLDIVEIFYVSTRSLGELAIMGFYEQLVNN
jgi:hypothetical protein